MSVLTRNNIVTNGLVLYLDAKNPQSIPVDPTINLLTNSQNFTGSGWFSTNMTVTTSSMVAPYGNGTATLISTFNSFSALSPSINVTGGGIYTTSYFVKYVTQSIYTLVHEGSPYSPVTFDIQAGKILSIGGTPGFIYTASIAPAPNDYYRISLTVNITQSLFTLTPRLWTGYYNGNSYSGSQLYVWGAQVERSSYPTPYIASITSSGQRTSWFDLSGNNNTAVLSTGSISSSIPQYNYLNERVLNFDGTGSYAFISSSWSYLSSSAIETVFSVNGFQSSEVTSIGGYDQNSTSTFGRSVAGMIYLQNNNKQIEASVITLTQTYRTVTSTTIVNTGSYYHVVLNKDTTAGTLQLYVNGRLESTNTFDTGSYAQWFSTGSFQGSNVIQISNTISTNLAAWIGGKYLNGKIPLFKLYNRTLTQNEIIQNYNAAKTRFGLT